MPLTFADLAHASPSRLEALLRAGAAPPPETIAGVEWRGLNTGLPPRLLGLQKFIKGFFRDAGGVAGYNIPVAQNGVAAPWLPLPSAEAPRRYAFYTVAPVNPASTDRLYPSALLLNYGLGRPSPGSPFIARLLRDYLLAPDPANPDLLLGKAYFALGPLRLPSNFFILERLGPTPWQPSP
jgi:hypothetical protein